MHPQLPQLKKRIAKLVPSVMDLSFGCRVYVQNYFVSVTIIQDRRGFTWLEENESNADFHGFATSDAFFDEKHITEIIGHPITLSIVLQAIHNRTYAVDARGEFIEFFTSESCVSTKLFWPLEADNIDNASHETIDFLISLLGVKE